MQKVKKSKVLRTSQMKTYLEPKKIERIEQSAECLRDKLLVRLLARLGCRVSEALGITVDDIDFDQGTVTIVHLKRRIKLSCPTCRARLSRTARFCPGCGLLVAQAVIDEREHRRHRVLPVDDDTMNMLKEYITRGGPVSRNGHRLLFEMTREYAWLIVKDCAARAGLDQLVNRETGALRGISPHRLRDAFAVHAIKLDGTTDGIRLLHEHMGHQSIATTMKYRKVSGDEHRDWYHQLKNTPENPADRGQYPRSTSPLLWNCMTRVMATGLLPEY
ncbi:tyrosine-type recombinase/integrase [Chloroflexota bacterium]